MQNDRGTNALLRWLAVAVPGLSGGVGWAAAAGYPLLVRALCGVAAAVTIYALLHVLLRGIKRDRH